MTWDYKYNEDMNRQEKIKEDLKIQTETYCCASTLLSTCKVHTNNND